MNDGVATIDISNRYFTPVVEAGGMTDVNFLPGVDPKGILHKMAQGDGSSRPYYHTEDNQVFYYATRRDSDGQRK